MLKSLIYNKAYIHLYPMSEKKQTICDEINTCDLGKPSQLADDINQLYEFVLSDADIAALNTDITNRQLDNCYRSKRIKIKDEETNKKVVEKITVQRKGAGIKQDIGFYNKKIKNIKADTLALEALASAIEQCNLTEEQLVLCDKVLFNNRFNPLVYRIGIAVVIGLIILAVVSAIIH